uniref:heterogeneous nuclear ribonucleoprotein D-like n=1 Tax=Myxine glutinosa TaxID=7769 RepID=UPI00358F3740
MAGGISCAAARVEPARDACTCRQESEDDASQGEDADGAKINASRRKVDDCKMFVGGLSKETCTTESLRDYFSQFGEVVDCTIKTHLHSSRSRGFGFVTFCSAAAVDEVLAIKNHQLNGAKIFPKRVLGFKQRPVKKIFVGGVSPEIDKDKILEYFSTFGEVEGVSFPVDLMLWSRQSYCFVTFQDDDSVLRAMKTKCHVIGDCR